MNIPHPGSPRYSAAIAMVTQAMRHRRVAMRMNSGKRTAARAPAVVVFPSDIQSQPQKREHVDRVDAVQPSPDNRHARERNERNERDDRVHRVSRRRMRREDVLQ
jgi:hypothetical protein